MPKGVHSNHARGPANAMFKHGEGHFGKRTPLYRLWMSMRSRCNNPNQKDYPYYGGRGITVCKRWDSYKQFAADVGPHPGGGMTLDRKNNSKGYSPGNVRWATRMEQRHNRRDTPR